LAREADPEDLSYGLEEAFNDDDTPAFEEMTAQLYERLDPDTRAGLLDLLGQAALSVLMSGMARGRRF